MMDLVFTMTNFVLTMINFVLKLIGLPTSGILHWKFVAQVRDYSPLLCCFMLCSYCFSTIFSCFVRFSATFMLVFLELIFGGGAG